MRGEMHCAKAQLQEHAQGERNAEAAGSMQRGLQEAATASPENQPQTCRGLSERRLLAYSAEVKEKSTY